MSISSSSLVAHSVSRCRERFCVAATRDRLAVRTPRFDRGVALRLVQRDGLGLQLARLEQELRVTDPACLALDGAQHGATDAVATLVRVDVHALHLADVFVV